jgi:hypothetical protein
MSIASELLISSKRRAEIVDESVGGVGGSPLKRVLGLEGSIFGLLCEHEPNPELRAQLLRDFRIMCLSGLVDVVAGDARYREYRRAAEDMGGVLRVIPG